MQEAFEKLRGVDIFSLKSYMEPTSALRMKKKKLTKSSLIRTQAPLKEANPVGSI